MTALASAGNSPLVSRSTVRSSIRDALRLYVGRGRRYSVKRLSNGTGVPDRMIEAAMCEPDDPDYRPLSLENLVSISAFLGAPFTSDWLALAGLGAFELPDHHAPHPGEIVAHAASGTAELAERAADGEFCEDDREALRDVGHRDIQRGIHLVTIAAEPKRRRA